MLKHLNTFLIFSVACVSVNCTEQAGPVVQEKEDLRLTNSVLSLLRKHVAAGKLKALQNGNKISINAVSKYYKDFDDATIAVDSQGSEVITRIRSKLSQVKCFLEWVPLQLGSIFFEICVF